MKTKRIFSILAAVVFLGLLLIGALSSFITNYWWFDSLGFSSVFRTTYTAEYSLWIAGFLVSLLILNLNISISLKSQSTLSIDPRIEQFIQQFGRFIRIIAFGGAAFFAFIMAGVLSANWMEMLTFLNSQAFNVADPVFGNDVGFYMFTLPFISILRGWLLGLCRRCPLQRLSRPFGAVMLRGGRACGRGQKCRARTSGAAASSV